MIAAGKKLAGSNAFGGQSVGEFHFFFLFFFFFVSRDCYNFNKKKILPRSFLSTVDIFLFLELFKAEWMKLTIRPRLTCRPNFLRPPITPTTVKTNEKKKKKSKPGENEESDAMEMNSWMSTSKNASVREILADNLRCDPFDL